MEIVSLPGTGLTHLVVRNTDVNGEERSVTFFTASYERSTYLDTEKIFRDINAFWKSLPKEKQTMIYMYYQHAYELLSTEGMPEVLQGKLIRLAENLYNEITFQELDTWFRKHGTLEVPPSVKSFLEPGDVPDKTYLKDDYIALLVLALGFRPLVPLFGSYIRFLGKQSVTSFKERVAMTIASGTWLVKIPAMDRLMRYITASTQNQPQTMSTLLKGLGSHELSEWAATQIIVRQLSICYTHNDVRSNVIANIFKYLTELFSGIDRRFEGTVKQKYPLYDIGDENQSLIEQYKIKQQIATGDYILVSAYTEYVDSILAKTDPNIQRSMFDVCYKNIVKNKARLSFGPAHDVLAQYTVTEIPAEALDNLPLDEVCIVMAVAQAALWTWGFYDLAALITAVPIKSASGETSILAAGQGGRLAKANLDKMLAMFPYVRASKENAGKASEVNYGYRALNEVYSRIAGRVWRMYGPPELVKLVSCRHGNDIWDVPPDLKNQICLLICKITGA